MKKVILFIFLALGIISFSADYSKGAAAELKLVPISGNEYGFDITYYPEKDGTGKDEPLKARESKTEIGIAVKKGNTYYYEGESYGELCKIEITEKAFDNISSTASLPKPVKQVVSNSKIFNMINPPKLNVNCVVKIS